MTSKTKERRVFPRHEANVKVKVEAAGSRKMVFEAFLSSRDVSMGGMFLVSEFFVKTKTKLKVEFSLPGIEQPLQIRGVVIRETKPAGKTKKGHGTGFAIKFIEYLNDSKILLAKFFMTAKVEKFVATYFRSGRQRQIRSEEGRMVDLLVLWELDRMEKSENWEL